MIARVAFVALVVAARSVVAQEQFAQVIDVSPVVRSSGPDYDLFDVSHVRTLSDRRIALLNAGTSEVFLFYADGRLERRFGGRGQGPGEFTSPQFMAPVEGDSILVVDLVPLPQRVTVFTPTGDVARTFSLDVGPPGGYTYVFPMGITRDRTIVAGRGVDPDLSSLGITRTTAAMLLYDRTGAFREIVQPEAISTDWIIVDVGGQRRAMAPPFMRMSRIAAGPEGFALGTMDSPDVLIFDSSGRSAGTLRAPAAPPLPRDAAETARAAFVEEATNDAIRNGRRIAVEEAPPPIRLALDELQIDLTGRVWVRSPNPANEGLARWHVHRGQALLGYVDLPADLAIREIGADHVLAVETDELDVERVLRLRLRVLR